jgi:hypothetical protein
MLYAILCYNDDDIIAQWSKAEDDAVMGRLVGVTQKIAASGRLGPVARLEPARQAKVLRKGKDGPTVTDGPFAESKEMLLGFYLVECDTIDEAVDIAKDLQAANAGPSAYDIRPVMFFNPGGPAPTVR